MEKKQACHVEWGRLQLTGQAPIMAGAAIGASEVMWVACRTSKSLVHVFQDGHLMSIWRFTSDPVCLRFGPSFRSQAAADTSADNSSTKTTEASLLVITSDGRIWYLELPNICLPENERSTKRRKKGISSELPKAVQETLITKVDVMSSWTTKSRQNHKRDIHKNPDVFGSKFKNSDVDYPPDRGRDTCRVQESGDTKHISTNANFTSVACSDDRQQRFSGLKSQWEKLVIHTPARYSKKPEVRLVSAAALLGMGSAVSVAAYGPNSIVALVAPSGAVNIINLGFSHLYRGPSVVTSVCHEGSVTMNSEPACILFVSVMLEVGTLPPRGDDAVVSKRLFEALFGGVRKTTPTFGLLRGDRDGFVYTILLDPSEAGVVSCTRVLCNLAQPVVAILVIPSDKSARQKHERFGSRGPSKASERDGDSILILGQLGRVILIKGIEEESNEMENGTFLPTRRSFSWRTTDKSSTGAQLTEKNLAIHEWDLSCSITSACMLGPCRLCYCSRSEVLYVDLFEIIGHGAVHLKIARTENIMPFTSKRESIKTLSQASSSGFQAEKWVVKEELVSHMVPVADVVVAIVGKGILGSSGRSRPLVALTARGRLLGVEVTEHVSSPTMTEVIDVYKSWRPLQARREEQVKDLLQTVSEVEEQTAIFKRHHSSITLFLKELANALSLAYDICTDQTRDIIHCPDLSILGEAPPSKLWSFLTVTAHPSVLISPQNLSFGAGVQKILSNHGSNPHGVKISIMLHNQTAVPLSPYWSLLLELQGLYSDSSEVLSHSTVINRGFGLPVGAHFSHDFFAELPSTGFCPLLASLFLCHLHDPHQSVTDGRLPRSTFSTTLSQNFRGSIPSKIPLDMRDKLQSKRPVSEKEQIETGFVDDIPTCETSGSVCLLLARYRIDLLSLLRPPPPQSGVGPWIYPNMGVKSEQLEASYNSDHLLGMISGTVTLSHIENATFNELRDMRKLWQGLHLEDLMQGGSLSKAGGRISFSAPDDGPISVSLESRSTRWSASILLLFQGSSLLLGSLAREALLWRISECETKLVLQESVSQEPLDVEKFDAHSRMNDGKPGKANELVQQLQTVTSLWKDIFTSRDSVLFASLLDDTGSTGGAVLRMYRNHRENSPSLCTT